MKKLEILPKGPNCHRGKKWANAFGQMAPLDLLDARWPQTSMCKKETIPSKCSKSSTINETYLYIQWNIIHPQKGYFEFATTRMNLESTMLCEISDKDRHYMISVLHGGLWKQSAKNKKKTRTKEQIGGCRRLGKWWRGSKVQTQVIGGCVMYSVVTIVNNICIFYLKVVKQVAIKSSHYKKNFGVMTMLTRLFVIISQHIR